MSLALAGGFFTPEPKGSLRMFVFLFNLSLFLERAGCLEAQPGTDPCLPSVLGFIVVRKGRENPSSPQAETAPL